MKDSKNRKESKSLRVAFLKPPASHEIDQDPVQDTLIKHRREATVYDAVAGRISSNGFIPDRPFTSKYRDTLSSSEVAVPPEEVLFRRKNAPTRYEENDIYFASSNLLPHQKLPESDLLKAVHTYTSDFYERATRNPLIDYKSMDETALIALGILLEEATGPCLGQTGDLAFVEGEEEERPAAKVERPLMGQTTKGLGSVITRRRKRRKIHHQAERAVDVEDSRTNDKPNKSGRCSTRNSSSRKQSPSDEGSEFDKSRDLMKAD